MDDDQMIKLRSMVADVSLGDRFIGYPMNRPSPSKLFTLYADMNSTRVLQKKSDPMISELL